MTPLEQALLDARQNPASRNEFYRILLDSAILVLVPKDYTITLDPKTREVLGLDLVNIWDKDGNPLVPFFSSPEWVGELPDTGRQAGKAKLHARQFFKIIRSARCVLNPNSGLTKEFTTEEVSALLDGSIFN